MKRLLMIVLLSLPGIVAALEESEDLPPMSYDEAALLPIRSPSLRPGPVEPRANNLPGITALFLIGDDPRSHAWLQQRLPELQRLAATTPARAATPRRRRAGGQCRVSNCLASPAQPRPRPEPDSGARR